VKKLLFLSTLFLIVLQLRAQKNDCVFKPPIITIHFGSGNVQDVNSDYNINYDRVSSSCPTDGHYTFTGFTSDCFRGDWHTIADHTTANGDGNMMLVNASPSPGMFLKTPLSGLKRNTIYEFGVWMMNVCKPSDKCPYPLLPNIVIRLETPDGKLVAKLTTGDLPRLREPGWIQYRALFTSPASASDLMLTMIDNAPGGCGNDFALDDITLRECIIPPPPVTKTTKSSSTPPKKTTEKKAPATAKTTPKKPAQTTVKKDTRVATVNKPAPDSLPVPQTKSQNIFPTPPKVLTTRENAYVKRIETEPGEIKIDLYDNGEIDGDTVSIYHNNTLIASHAGLSQKPISFKVSVNDQQPHHELVMVAENLGSIPPNTSVMIVTAGNNRYEVFISSTTKKNAKVVIDLKK
jgi:hypothetical protein